MKLIFPCIQSPCIDRVLIFSFIGISERYHIQVSLQVQKSGVLMKHETIPFSHFIYLASNFTVYVRYQSNKNK